MNTVAPPVLCVRYDGSERTFAAGRDVVVGREPHADIRVEHPLASRVHLVLRCDRGSWVGIDNHSRHGTYVNNRRLEVFDIGDGQSIHLGSPDGPCLICEVTRDGGMAGRPPRTAPTRVVQPNPSRPPPPPRPRSGSRPPAPQRPSPPPPAAPTTEPIRPG
ncbi:MAG: FHA domain-containing protein, partial [Mycobacterium sp.]|nr:FHA domain-containing protein [Mycobacterium sp.]